MYSKSQIKRLHLLSLEKKKEHEMEEEKKRGRPPKNENDVNIKIVKKEAERIITTVKNPKFGRKEKELSIGQPKGK